MLFSQLHLCVTIIECMVKLDGKVRNPISSLITVKEYGKYEMVKLL